MKTPVLSLADVEAFDPRAVRGGRERVTRCPICQASERGFHINMETGVYNCKRGSCGARGKLSDYWEQRPRQNQKQRVRAALDRAFALPSEPPIKPAPDETWREMLNHAQPLASTAGAVYVEGRGIPVELAHEQGVRFSLNWAPRNADTKPYTAGPAVLFPMRDLGGKMVATQGRYVRPDSLPKMRTGGDNSAGVFATAGALKTQTITLCEGPMDALSLLLCGFPAVAVTGCNLPEWMPEACAFKLVLIAPDADDAGDRAAEAWTARLGSFGARCRRLRPANSKDWNEMLQHHGAASLAVWLGARLDHIRHFSC